LTFALAASGWAADAELTKLIEAAKKDGEVHFLDALVTAKTSAALERAFKKKYGLPDGFKFNHTLRGTGEVVATSQQEIKAGQYTSDVVSVSAPSFFHAAGKDGHFLPYAPADWRLYEREVKRLGLEADPPNWITPVAYAFIPVWNKKCPGFANVRIASWRDTVNPAFKGKIIISDVRKSFSYMASWVGMEGALGKDFFPKFVEVTQPAVFFRTEEVMQKVASCEYPIALWQLPSRVNQRVQEDATLDIGMGWPQEGVTLLGVPFAIFKGAKHPSAAKLLMDFFLSEEGMREMMLGEGVTSMREGFKTPEAARPYVADMQRLKSLPMNWPSLTLAEARRVQDEFRRVLKLD
jgi:ABC-type Fe3+ transport system substrate-binding protein